MSATGRMGHPAWVAKRAAGAAAIIGSISFFSTAGASIAADAGTGGDAGVKAGVRVTTPPAAILHAPMPAASNEPAHFVLVRAGARLHTAVPPAGRRVRLPGLAIDTDSPQAASRFRLVRAAGEWVEVETISTDLTHPHCHAPPSAFAGLTLRLFVAAADLQPLTVRRVHLALDDTGAAAIDLEPGVPIARDGDHWQAFPDANVVPIDPPALPADAVGVSYAPILAHAIADAARVLTPPSRLSAGGLKLTTDARRSEAQCEWSAGRDGALGAYVQMSGPEREHHVAVHVQTACALYESTVDAAALSDAQAPADERSLLTRHGRNRFSARPGATVRWPDGATAGHVSGDVPIPDDAGRDHQRPCFDWSLATGGHELESTLRLCLAPADVVESPAFLSDQQVSMPTAQTRRQVAIKIDNQTARTDRDVGAAVRTAARRRLYALGDVVLVPPGEESARTLARAQKAGLTQYRVDVHLEETLGGTGGMTQRLVATKLIRIDGTSDGRTVKSDEAQQIQSAGDTAQENNAFEEILDEAFQQMAAGLGGDH